MTPVNTAAFRALVFVLDIDKEIDSFKLSAAGIFVQSDQIYCQRLNFNFDDKPSFSAMELWNNQDPWMVHCQCSRLFLMMLFETKDQ